MAHGRAAILKAVLAAAFAGALPASPAHADRLPLAGLNIAGGEFGAPPGVHGRDYIHPTQTDLDYARAKGFALVRAPFLWERLQPAPGAEFDKDELARLTELAERAQARGLAIVLDAHNYGRRDGAPIGSPAVPDSQFADFWRRMARAFGGRPGVIFGLMNEPHDQPVDRWARSAQVALDAIRAAGACNPVLVPGAEWTGAHSWNAPRDGLSNAQAMARFRRRGETIFEFHQYLDPDSSGRGGQCVAPREAVARLAVATGWLRANRARGFLGEFGAGDSENCRAGVEAMLAHMKDNADVWAGWAWWAAGAWWPKDYPLSLQPVDGKDRPQLATLSRWMAPRKPLEACRLP